MGKSRLFGVTTESVRPGRRGKNKKEKEEDCDKSSEIYLSFFSLPQTREGIVCHFVLTGEGYSPKNPFGFVPEIEEIERFTQNVRGETFYIREISAMSSSPSSIPTDISERGKFIFSFPFCFFFILFFSQSYFSFPFSLIFLIFSFQSHWLLIACNILSFSANSL